MMNEREKRAFVRDLVEDTVRSLRLSHIVLYAEELGIDLSEYGSDYDLAQEIHDTLQDADIFTTWEGK